MIETRALLAVGLCAIATGCSSSTDAGAGSNASAPGSVNVAQGGAQDFAEFRAIVEKGEIPAPDMLDPVGFFAEHAVDLPPADCGADLCLHPMLAVMPKFDHSNWTMAFVAMNTPLDPATLPRPPVHLALAIELGSAPNELWPQLVSGVANLCAALRPEDRVSLVVFGSTATTLLTAVVPTSPDLPTALEAAAPTYQGNEGVSLYDGLAEAERTLRGVPGFDGAQRIVLVTTGRADAGITDPAHIVALAEGIALEGIALGVVGLGADYDGRIPSALGSLGAGTYAYAAPGELDGVLTSEGETTLFPLATDFRMRITPSTGYRVGRVYGVKRATSAPTLATLDLPALFIGARKGSQDVGGGRRGGGGGLFVELLAGGPSASGVGAGAPAFSLDATWTSSAGQPVSTSTPTKNALAPGQNPPTMWPSLSDPARGKPFMMLNMYLALKASVDFYASGDCAHAIGVIDMMGPSIDGWQGKYADPDLAADDQLMLELRSNLTKHCQAVTPILPNKGGFEGGCGML